MHKPMSTCIRDLSESLKNRTTWPIWASAISWRSHTWGDTNAAWVRWSRMPLDTKPSNTLQIKNIEGCQATSLKQMWIFCLLPTSHYTIPREPEESAIGIKEDREDDIFLKIKKKYITNLLSFKHKKANSTVQIMLQGCCFFVFFLRNIYCI